MKCPRCQSQEYSKNGSQRDKQKYICKACGRQWLNPPGDRGYPNAVRMLCVKMHQNGLATRELERYTGISHNTIVNWIKDSQQRTADTLPSVAAEECSDLESSRFVYLHNIPVS